MIGFRKVWGVFEGVWVGQGGVCLTHVGDFLPLWKSCKVPDLVLNTA